MVNKAALSRAVSGGIALAALTIGGVGVSATAANAAPRSTWDALAQCESSGNWSIDTGNGYYGGLQFSLATWAAHGGHGSPARSSKAEQIAVGERVLASQGWSAWPACSARLGLSGRSHATAHTATSRVKVHRSSGGAKHRAVVRTRVELPLRDAHPKRTEHHHAGPRHAALRAGRHVAAAAVSGTTYRVRAGDTLEAIAAHLHVAGGWQALADASHLAHPDQIFPGQVLHLPAK